MPDTTPARLEQSLEAFDPSKPLQLSSTISLSLGDLTKLGRKIYRECLEEKQKSLAKEIHEDQLDSLFRTFREDILDLVLSDVVPSLGAFVAHTDKGKDAAFHLKVDFYHYGNALSVTQGRKEGEALLYKLSKDEKKLLSKLVAAHPDYAKTREAYAKWAQIRSNDRHELRDSAIDDLSTAVILGATLENKPAKEIPDLLREAMAAELSKIREDDLMHLPWWMRKL